MVHSPSAPTAIIPNVPRPLNSCVFQFLCTFIRRTSWTNPFSDDIIPRLGAFRTPRDLSGAIANEFADAVPFRSYPRLQ